MGQDVRAPKNLSCTQPCQWQPPCWTTIHLVVCTVLLFAAGNLVAAAVQASRSEITLPTYPWAAVKHPYFRGTDKVNIYPYPMLDFLSREKTNRTYRTVVLENEYLRITFLPELGGKIHEVIDKTTGQPMFYVNHVIKPGLIGQCGAWISGGVEWNTGPQGHTVSAVQPVPVVILPPEPDGSRAVAIGETERIYGTRWTVIVTLRPGRSFIEERIRIYNPTETVRPYYFWNCTAVPNTPGFRFIYPMTLGTDHGSEKFFDWPIDHGKDLTRGTNYQDASSIFAWHCDQDFFGSYDDGADRGVVSYANHHQVPGKKAWTWGQGGYGKLNQMNLTDTDGPYNEVQTGPLLTQGEVGRLDPCEAVEWQEWWYPVHGMGGFTFANKEVAVNASRNGTNLILRVIGTANWRNVAVSVWLPGSHDRAHPDTHCEISARRATVLKLGLPEFLAKEEWFYVELRHRDTRLALFPLPLQLPKREPPPKKTPPQTATELAQAGWQDFLFARQTEAESRFRKALEADPKSAPARVGLAFLRLDSDPKAAMLEAADALASAPDSGLAHYAIAVAADRLDDRVTALNEAWKASLDPATAVPARALLAKLMIRFADYQETVAMLSGPGPWQVDSVCRNRLAVALLELGRKRDAVTLAKANLADDPLDVFARSILWLAGSESEGVRLGQLLQDNPYALLGLVADHSASGLERQSIALRLLKEYVGESDLFLDESGSYWTKSLLGLGSHLKSKAQTPHSATAERLDGNFPYRLEAVVALRTLMEQEPTNGQAALQLGHLLFHLGRHAEGRDMWKRAAELGASPVIAYRALGMAAKTLDNDLKTARDWLEKANQADPADAIVARDLANVLFALADQAAVDADKRALLAQARDRLKAALASGQGRSDFVSLLARAQNRLGEFAETARLLDAVRVTVWEGAREVHDLFEEAHLALGQARLEAGRAAEALVEFNRALEYPENLATGKLENAREALIHYGRGNALAALGQKPAALEAWRKAADEPASKDPKQEDARKKAREALGQPGN